MTISTKVPAKPATVGVNIKLPKALHRKLRLKQVEKDLTLDEAIAEAVTKWVGR